MHQVIHPRVQPHDRRDRILPHSKAHGVPHPHGPQQSLDTNFLIEEGPEFTTISWTDKTVLGGKAVLPTSVYQAIFRVGFQRPGT